MDDRAPRHTLSPMRRAVWVLLDGMRLNDRICCLFDGDMHCGAVTRLSPDTVAFRDGEGATWEVPRGWVERERVAEGRLA
jgi:hypothetical protein